MFKNIFCPTPQNAFIWLSSIYLLFLLYLGKANAITILFAYFLETILIGVFNVLKMVWTIYWGKSTSKQFSLVLFFLVHYGFFVAIQSIFGFALFGFTKNPIINEPFNLIENYSTILQLEDIQYALPAIIFMHLGKFISDFIGQKKYLKFTAKELMFKPYLRIFIQQFVVIISFFFIVFDEGAGIIAAILLISFRLIIDLFFEAIRENNSLINDLSVKLANEKLSADEIKKQLISYTE
ncbi:DUF6498-containing protein [Polaribacter dokdonensis]|uniref:Transmembrane protein n=1 Tax=Polaribacter dokdonensis DSW-5 TaxID=1300348 RepID=A0A0M9CGA9_9FLAO|nr:DUF6498-containing protein [Polaribacter dokdonensis]KOY51893.1 hypothetical protein I602_1453 [Polaribacter dokdonensis DSW-5]SEE00413.1 hypothetical protein SAMN05444353_0315 [Polaribacter dokdonensis DSW-5]